MNLIKLQHHQLIMIEQTIELWKNQKPKIYLKMMMIFDHIKLIIYT